MVLILLLVHLNIISSEHMTKLECYLFSLPNKLLTFLLVLNPTEVS